jgi:hypothetical protein
MARAMKPHLEFYAVDLREGWHVPPAYPPDIEQKILAGALDGAHGTGSRTRLLRFGPGAHTSTPFVHAYWEEVYLLSGDLYVADTEGDGRFRRFGPNSYACRPPGVQHGPFRFEDGCLLLVFHYYCVSG